MDITVKLNFRDCEASINWTNLSRDPSMDNQVWEIEKWINPSRCGVDSPANGTMSLCEKSGQRPRVANQGEYPNEQKNTTNIYRWAKISGSENCRRIRKTHKPSGKGNGFDRKCPEKMGKTRQNWQPRRRAKSRNIGGETRTNQLTGVLTISKNTLPAGSCPFSKALHIA